MFTSKDRHTETNPEQYLRRIAELEAELDTAYQLIADQQQILKSNLSASIAPDSDPLEGEDTPHLDSMTMAPLRFGHTVQALERPPIKLPDFGPPVVDIAQKVLQAANEKGVLERGCTNRTATGAPLPQVRREYRHDVEEAPPSDLTAARRKYGKVHPLGLSAVLLIVCAVTVVSALQYQNFLAKANNAHPAPTTTAPGASAEIERNASNPLPESFSVLMEVSTFIKNKTNRPAPAPTIKEAGHPVLSSANGRPTRAVSAPSTNRKRPRFHYRRRRRR